MRILITGVAGSIGSNLACVPWPTATPTFLEKAVDHKYSRETVRGFNADARKALAEMQTRRPK